MARTSKKAITIDDLLQKSNYLLTVAPYQIPQNWCWTSLGKVCELGKGTSINHKSLPYWDAKSLRGMKEPDIIDSGIVVNAGEKVILVDGENSGEVFSVFEQGYMGSTFRTLHFSNIANEEYATLFIDFHREQLRKSKIGSAIPHLNKELFFELSFPLPPLAEQQRIVDRIESLFAKLDEAKEKAQAVVDGFEDRRAAMLHKAFTGELTEAWRRNNSVGKESWKVLGFDDCVDVMQNGIAKRKGDTGEPYVVLRLANLSDDDFDETDLREIVLDEKEQKNYGLHSDDVLMVRVNGSKDNVGKQYRITNQKRWAFCDHIIRIKYVNSIVPQYMVYFSKSETYRQYIKDNMVSSAGQNTISRKGMARLQIPIPQKDEQEQIVSILSNLFEKEQQVKEAAEQVIDQINAMKKSILARAFRGELGTNDPNDEPAIELLKRINNKGE